MVCLDMLGTILRCCDARQLSKRFALVSPGSDKKGVTTHEVSPIPALSYIFRVAE